MWCFAVVAAETAAPVTNCAGTDEKQHIALRGYVELETMDLEVRHRVQ